MAQIVKVRYLSDKGTKLSDREYSYFSEEPLVVGDEVNVPVQGFSKSAKVTAVDLPEESIAKFRDAVKLIPVGSIISRPAPAIPATAQEDVARDKPGPVDPWDELESAGSGNAQVAVNTPEDFNPADIMGRMDVDEAASAEAGTLVGDIKMNPEFRPDPEPPSSEMQVPFPMTEDQHNDPLPQEPPDTFPTEEEFTTEVIDELAASQPAGAAAEFQKDVAQTIIPTGTALIEVSPEDDEKTKRLYEEGLKMAAAAEKRVIASNDDLKPAADDLALCRRLKSALEKKRKEYVDPINKYLEHINGIFRTMKLPFDQADKTTSAKIVKFEDDQKKRAAEAQRIEDEKFALAQREAALKDGEITTDLNPVPAPPPTPARIRTSTATVSGRDNWKARVVDFKLLPDEYKIPNEQALNAFARSTKGQREIPGVEFYNERSIVSRNRNG